MAAGRRLAFVPFKPRSPSPCQPIKLRFSSRLRFLPLGLDPGFLFQSIREPCRTNLAQLAAPRRRFAECDWAAPTRVGFEREGLDKQKVPAFLARDRSVSPYYGYLQ